MGPSGVIYGIIVCLWLCYLVPLALRRHDEAARARSVDRFSAAMRVLGRTDARAPGPAAVRRAARAAAARRRRVLVLLLALAAAVAGVAAVGRLPVWSPAVPGALVVAFLVTARLQVRRARTSTWERSLRSTAATAVAPAGDEPDDAPTVVLDAVLQQQQVVAAPVSAADASLWDPLPVTLPSYVSKPRAERSIRTVDLSGAGSEAGSEAGSQAGSETASSGASVGALRAVGD